LDDLALDDLGRAGQTHPDAAGVLLGDALLETPAQDGLRVGDGDGLASIDELDGVLAHAHAYTEP